MINGEVMKKRSDNYANPSHPSARQHIAKRELKATAGTLVCAKCGAGYHDKHWYSEDQSLRHDMIIEAETLCPGCYRVENKICNGTVVIEGAELKTIREELLRVIDRVSHECWLDNPTSRLFDLTVQKYKIELRTTTVWLATRIGKSLKKIYDGVLEIKRSPEKDSVYVHWVGVR